MNWTDVILSNTQLRMERLIRDLKRQAHGDDEYFREEDEVAAADAKARKEPGPPPEARRRLIPNWAWNKRQRGR